MTATNWTEPLETAIRAARPDVVFDGWEFSDDQAAGLLSFHLEGSAANSVQYTFPLFRGIASEDAARTISDLLTRSWDTVATFPPFERASYAARHRES